MDAPFKTKKRNESGSVLWFILLGIALLAALAVTITRSSRTAEQNGGIEQARITASSVLRTAAALDEAVQQMQTRGVSENELSFNSPKLAYPTAQCPAASCLVFDAGGGGQTYTGPPAGSNDGSDWLFTGANAVTNAGDTNGNELLMILSGLSQPVCQQIDTALGIASIPQNTGAIDTTTKFDGSFTGNGAINAPAGQKAACISDTSGKYYFYNTLIAR